jgi:hypothetical protein
MSNWQTYQSPHLGFTLNVPEEWTKEEDASGTIVLFSPVKTSNPGDMTEPAVNVMTQDLSNEQVTTLDEYTEKTLKQMRDIPDFPADQLKVEPAMLGGLKATKCMYVAPIDEDTMIQFFQIWTLKDKVAYIFTFSCESSLFEKYQKTIATMLQTFKLIKIKKQIKHVVLRAHVHESLEHRFAVRVPLSWAESAVDSIAAVKGQLIGYNYVSREGSEVSHISLAVHASPLPASASYTIKDVSRIARIQISKLLPLHKVTMKKSLLSGIPSRVAIFSSNSLAVGDRFMQVFTLRNNFIYTLTLIANTPEEDDERPFKIFERIVASFQFLQANEKPKYATLASVENLIHRFGIYFNQQTYTPKEDFLGMTLAIIKSSELEIMRNYPMGMYLPVHISLVIRDIGNEPDVSLDSIAFELIDQAKKMVEETGARDFKVLQNDSCDLGGEPGKVLRLSGGIETPMGRNTRVIMQKFALRNNMALLISFSTVGNDWDREYAAAQKYIDSFYYF